MKKWIKVLIAISASLLVVIAAFLIFIHIEEPHADVSLIAANLNALEPQHVKIDGLEVIAQPDAASCGITTISMLASYITGGDISPVDLIQKYELTGGMSIEQFKEILLKELSGYEVIYKSNLSDLELIEEIHAQLAQGMPVAVFFGAKNPYNEPYYDFHASVVTAMDLSELTVDIANAYGYKETISMNEFLDRISYSTTGRYPLVQKAILKLGLMDENAVFILQIND